MAKQLKIGVQLGAGPGTGYLWDVWILDLAFEEAMRFLDTDQYAYIAEQVQQLALEQSPTHSVLASIDAIDDFHELREKGGVLGKKNVRVFFTLDKRQLADRSLHSIVVLGAFKKESEGRTPESVKIRIRRRLRKYLAGDYGPLPQ